MNSILFMGPLCHSFRSTSLSGMFNFLGAEREEGSGNDTRFIPGSSSSAMNYQAAYLLDGITRWSSLHAISPIDPPSRSKPLLFTSHSMIQLYSIHAIRVCDHYAHASASGEDLEL